MLAFEAFFAIIRLFSTFGTTIMIDGGICMSKKYCYLFTEGNANMRELLGGKGANLAEMTNLGMPVPQGFTITTEACTQYYADNREINDEIKAAIDKYYEEYGCK